MSLTLLNFIRLVNKERENFTFGDYKNNEYVLLNEHIDYSYNGIICIVEYGLPQILRDQIKNNPLKMLEYFKTFLYKRYPDLIDDFKGHKLAYTKIGGGNQHLYITL